MNLSLRCACLYCTMVQYKRDEQGNTGESCMGHSPLRTVDDDSYGTTQAHVLLLEDDPALAHPLISILDREGFAVEWAKTTTEATSLIQRSPGPDILIADRSLPDGDGLEVVQAAREAGYRGFIIMLSSRSSEIDQVQGLDVGADDYLAKPFSLAELVARLRASLRRSQREAGVASAQERDKRFVLDEATRRVFFDGVEIPLTVKEFGVLHALLKAEGAVVDRRDLIRTVWHEEWFGSTKALDVTAGRLRAKIAAAGATDAIVTVRGVGFRFEEPRAPVSLETVAVPLSG